jgi:hypothetical protein
MGLEGISLNSYVVGDDSFTRVHGYDVFYLELLGHGHSKHARSSALPGFKLFHLHTGALGRVVSVFVGDPAFSVDGVSLVP